MTFIPYAPHEDIGKRVRSTKIISGVSGWFSIGHEFTIDSVLAADEDFNLPARYRLRDDGGHFVLSVGSDSFEVIQ